MTIISAPLTATPRGLEGRARIACPPHDAEEHYP